MYGHMDNGEVVQNVAVKAVIINDGKILILREADTYTEGTQTYRYQLPGGRINPGEPFIEALHREVKEETGLQIEVGEPLYVGEWFPVIKGVSYQIVAVFLCCTPKTFDIKLSEEHDAFEWVSLEESQKLDVSPPYGQVIEAYFKRMQK